LALNSEFGEGDEYRIATSLRIARVNHACQPNAFSFWDETADVRILIALKDIQPGEEVTVCYYKPFFELNSLDHTPGMNPEWSVEEELNFVKNAMLFPIREIICPTDCSCFDPKTHALVQEGRQIRKTLFELALMLKMEEALEAGDKLLDIHRRLNISWEYICNMNVFFFKLAVMKSELLPRATDYLKSAVELYRKMCPYSEKYTKKYEKLLENPEKDPDYSKIDHMVRVLSERFGTGLNL